jgi:TolB-like protein/tetratricopeptide (TPR) repeat protein
MRILREFRERRLVQIGLSYAGASWAVMEVTDQLTGREILPEIMYGLVLIWIACGVPAALLIGWHHGEKGKQQAPRSEIAVLVLLALMAAGMSTSTVSRERKLQQFAAAAENPLEMRSIAVLYFRDNTDGEFQYLADGLTEELIAELNLVQGLTVVSRNGSALFRGQDVPHDSIARLLGAGTIVDGALDRRGNRLRLNIRIHEGTSGELWRRAQIDFDPDQGLAARDSVSIHVSRLLREWLGGEVRIRQTARNTDNAAAWSLLQRAEKARKDAEAAVSARDMDAADGLFTAADSLLGEAAQLDRLWADPLVERAAVAYRRARLVQTDPPEAMRWSDLALGFADQAIRRSRNSARALEIRGTTLYFQWLLGAGSNAAERDDLYARARTDLEAAVRFDGSLAGAHATLSHLYSLTDMSQAVVAARNALAADAFLESADVVRWRLFQSQISLGHFSQAQETCDDGARRAPDNFRFVSCRLQLLVTPHVAQPSIDSGWTYLAQLQEMVPAGRADYERVLGEMLVAGVIAKAARQDPALQDSARMVLYRAAARIDQRIDPTLHIRAYEAFIWTLVGDRDQAVATLNQLLAADPAYFSMSTGLTWRWRDLENDPRFRRMAGLN